MNFLLGILQTLKRATPPVARFNSVCFLNGTVRFVKGTVRFVNDTFHFFHGTVCFLHSTLCLKWLHAL